MSSTKRRFGAHLALLAVLVSAISFIAASPASAAVPNIVINEVESNGGSPGDWVELYNPSASPTDISGLKFLDNDGSHTAYTIPSGTIVAAGGFYMLEEAQFIFGLGAADSARLFLNDGTTLVDTYSWTAHATSTYGRCPDGSGAFVQTTSSKAAPNICGGGGSTTTTTSLPPVPPWPGDPTVQTVDNTSTFVSNLSGLMYEGSGSAATGVLWAVQNSPSVLYRLLFNGSVWLPDAASNWGSGKAMRYPDGTGDPDAEGVTFGGPSPSSGVYVATERDNSHNTVARRSILSFDPSASGATLTATHEWNLDADLPAATDPNLGLEGITWVPDSFLQSKGFLDESTGQAYNPNSYPNHGAGLFFVGLEQNGIVYAYALNHVTGGYTRIATISSGFPAVMEVQFDRDLNELWAVCDDGCIGRTSVLRIDPTSHKYVSTFTFERPAGMPNINNEGFAIAAATECANGKKPVFWSDDSDTDGHSLRSGNLPCAPVDSGVGTPAIPLGGLPVIPVVVVVGGWLLFGRRRLRLSR